MKCLTSILAICACTRAAAALEGRDFIGDLKALLAELPPSDDVDFPVELYDLMGYHLDPANEDVIITPSGKSISVPTTQPAVHQNAPRCVSAYIPNPNGAENGSGGSSADTADKSLSAFGFWVFFAFAMVLL